MDSEEGLVIIEVSNVKLTMENQLDFRQNSWVNTIG
jgi:hypothetical protein